MVVAMGIAAGISSSCRAAGTEKPRLVVGIVVDQMRWDYLMRYAGKWGEGGFRRLIDGGFSYDNTYLCYVPTVTAVGHASIYTGTTPAVHGIAGNKVRFAVESDLVKSLIEYRFYLDDDAIGSSHLDREGVKQELIRYLESDARVMQAIDYKKVRQTTVIPAIADRIVMGYNAKRSGDVIAVMQPGVYEVSQSSFKKGTTHGVWNPYDSHIPLIFYGWQIDKGRSTDSVQVIDIATTVCSMLGIQQPNGSVGKVLRSYSSGCPIQLSSRCPIQLSSGCPIQLSSECPIQLSSECPIHLASECPVVTI